MTDRRTARGPSVTRVEFDQAIAALAGELADAKKAQAEARAEQAEAHKELAELTGLVRAMHGGLMVPQHGYSESLLDRMAKATIAFESGGRTAGFLIKVGGAVGALSMLVGAFYAAVRFGGSPR